MTRLRRRLAAVLVVLLASVASGLLSGTENAAASGAALLAPVPKAHKKHQRFRRMPFKSGSHFIVTIVSSDNSVFSSLNYDATNVSCTYNAEDYPGQPVSWTFVKAVRSPNFRRLTLVFTAQDVVQPAPALPGTDPAPAPGGSSSGGTITITVTDPDGESEPDPGMEIPVEPVAIDPCDP